jgi:dATP pyrophosphohydrolase
VSATEVFRRPESVLVLVHDRDLRILLIRRRDLGFWQSVTGSLAAEEGEPAQAALREVFEETGIEAAPGCLEDLRSRARFLVHPAMRHRFAPGARYNTEYQFALAVPASSAVRLDPREHVDFRWCDASDARDLMWSWSNRLALDRLLERRRVTLARPANRHDRCRETG